MMAKFTLGVTAMMANWDTKIEQMLPSQNFSNLTIKSKKLLVEVVIQVSFLLLTGNSICLEEAETDN